MLLEASRLYLRQFRKADLEAFLAYRNDPEVAKYQSWDVPYPRHKAVEFIHEMVGAIPAPGKWIQTAIELKSTPEMIGDVAFHIKKDDERQAMIGYSLARPFWGNGYAFEAVSTLVGYLFSKMNMHRIVAECDVENTASWKLLEKLGFRREAFLVENIFFKGAYGSEYHYALLQREWQMQNSLE